MNKNCWILFGALLSTRLLAQQVADAPSAAPIETPPAAPAVTAPPAMAPAAAPDQAKTNAPATKAAKKKTPKAKADKKAAEKKAPAKKKDTAAELKTTPLVPGPAIVDARHVNLRGQPRLSGEVLLRLEKDTPVTVVEEITHNNSGPDEPSAWAKILLPTNAPVWVNTAFIDPASKTVVPKKLNMRGGPGENYSILGRLQHGEGVTAITTKGDWTQIQTPTNAYGFVAAQYLKQEAPGAVAPAPVAAATPAPAAPAEPAPVATAVPEAPAIASTTTETPPAASTNAPAEVAAAAPAPAATNATPAAPAPSAEPAAPAAEEPPAKRIVEHEGLVRGATSIQAPSHFALISPDNGQVINYLYTTSTNLDLRRYKGMRIVVTGEEGLDERWRNTPIIKIQKIQVVE